MSPSSIAVRLTLNGTARRLEVAPNRILADALREDFALTGTKIACDQATCGACTVLVDGAPTASCSTFAWQVDGKDVLTIEGLARDGALDPVQAAFKARSAFQCGYCTPGMILLTKALLQRHRQPDRATIRAYLSANVCRCTGYQMIVEAVEDAARRSDGAGG
ncbi:MAG: (2Fe-2S)-binding protein [Alphaproteobacteria bacterium]